MSQTIQFTVDDDQARLIDADAEGKGLTRSQFAKFCVMTQMNRNSTKGVQAELARIRQDHEERVAALEAEVEELRKHLSGSSPAHSSTRTEAISEESVMPDENPGIESAEGSS